MIVRRDKQIERVTTVGDLVADSGAVHRPEELGIDVPAGDGCTRRSERGPVVGRDIVGHVALRTGTGQRHVRVGTSVKAQSPLRATAELAPAVTAELEDRVAG